MADLTPERIAELRRTKALDTPPYLIYDEDLDALLDMAERCAKAEEDRSDAIKQISQHLDEIDSLKTSLAKAEAERNELALHVIRFSTKALTGEA